MIDLHTEHVLTLAEAARLIPPTGVAISTLWRWKTKGVRGVRLEAALIGGRWYTSAEAIDRFFAALAAKAGQEVATPTESAARKARIERAERRLAARGV